MLLCVHYFANFTQYLVYYQAHHIMSISDMTTQINFHWIEYPQIFCPKYLKKILHLITVNISNACLYVHRQNFLSCSDMPSTIIIHYVRFEVFVAVMIMMMFFWVLMPCGLVSRFQCFRETYCLHLPKRWHLPTSPHGARTQKNIIIIIPQCFHQDGSSW
jgi:hypothetical protein